MQWDAVITRSNLASYYTQPCKDSRQTTIENVTEFQITHPIWLKRANDEAFFVKNCDKTDGVEISIVFIYKWQRFKLSAKPNI